MKYINDKKEIIYNILRLLIILHFCGVSDGQGCQQSPKVVASCPQSAYDWIMHAKIVCTESNNYHCLITERHQDNKQNIIECCMKPQNITRGHMPRYNLNKKDLQEIECQEDYYMPTQFPSNRYRDHDVQHCKYMKSNCNMEGMKICNHGSTTTDRSCYCDYKELYVPELPLDPGEHCFSLKDNLCSLRNDCDKNYQELDMMYQCVNICKIGYFRPENEMICRHLPEGTTIAGKVTSEVSVPDNIKPTVKASTPPTSTKDNMVKPEMENQGTKDNHIVALYGVGLVCIATTIGGVVIGIFVLRRYKKGKFKVEDEESRLIPEIKVWKEKFREVYGSEVVLKVQIPFGVRSIYWLCKDHDDIPQVITSNDSRYSEFSISQPSLKIHNLCKQSAGSYICKVIMDEEEDTAIESGKIEVEVIEPVFFLKKTLIDVEYGREVTLECEMSHCPKRYDIYWEKEVDENIKELKISDETKEKYGGCTKSYPNLTIKDADHGDNALYCFCIKYQPSTDECEIFRSSKIKLHVVNEPVLTLTKPKETADYGHEVTLECRILHPPKLYDIFWEKEVDENVKELIISDETKEKYGGCKKGYPHLTIKDVDRGDNAFYSFCIKYQSSTGECKIFRSSSKIQLLVVNEPSIVLNKHTESVEIGKEISFGCVIHHKPNKKFEVIWEKIATDTKEKPEVIIFDEKTKEKYGSYNEVNPHLTIKSAEKSDDAFYRCCIKYSSSVGEQLVSSENIRLNVYEAKKTINVGDTHIGKQENVYVKKVGKMYTDKAKMDRDPSSSESSSEENDSESNKDPNPNDQTENTASRNEASASNASGSENQHVEQRPSDIDMGKEKRIKLQNLNPEEDSCFSEMERIADLKGYVVKNVRADGNCLFHAISHHIGDQISTEELRLKIVQYLEKNDTTPQGEKYSSFLVDQINDQNGDKWSQYLNSMKQQGTYGDELILRAISHHFRVQILVLSTESPKSFLKYDPVPPIEQRKTIHLGFMHENRHYVRLEEKEDSCFSEMKRLAGLHGFVVKNVSADGNCLFHAISHHIGDQISTHPPIAEEKASELRRKIVQYLEKNDTTPQGEKYSSFLEDQIKDQNGDKWSQYLNSMKQQGTYGDELILRAISHHFSVQILVLSTESPKSFLKYNPVPQNELTKTIHLGFMHENRHYVRLENKGTMNQQASKDESTV